MSLAFHVRRALLIALPILALAFAAWPGRPADAPSAFAGESELAGALGVNLTPADLTDPGLPAHLALLAGAGVRWVRFGVAWDQVEPQQGQADWRVYDRVFAALRQQADLRPLVVLNGAPAWARRPEDGDNPLAPPRERAWFGAFAAAVARRYGEQAAAYQIWHEPNIAPHWGRGPVSPEDYAGLLREAAVQIRATDRDARIVLAALAPNVEPGGANMSDVLFLEALYRAGAQPWFDVVAGQPFGFLAPADAPAALSALNFGRATLLRQVMARHGDAHKRIWATAFGWNALPAGWAGRPSPWGQVDEAQQAAYARRAVELAQTDRPWLGPLFWAAACGPAAADDPWQGFSLCTADGRPRPVWDALAQAAAVRPALPPGAHAVDHPAVRYGPGWRVTPAAADPSANGDRFAYDFWGDETALRVQGGPYWAIYRVWVDGQPANALPRDETGAAYLVLYDPLAETRLIPLARGLGAGRHQAVIEARGGWGQWALQGIVVRAAPSGLDRRTRACLAGVLAAAWLWLMRRRLAGAAAVLVRRLDVAAGQPAALWYAAGVGLAFLLVASRWLPLDLAALAGLGLLFLARPDAALPLIAAAIPLWPRPKLLAGFEFSLYELLVWLAAAAMVARWALAGLRGRLASPAPADRPTGPMAVACPRPRGLDWPVLALLAVGLLASLAAERTGVALREFRTVFLLGALCYGLATRAPQLAGRRFSGRPLIYGLLAGMTFVSLVALWQFISGQGRIDVEGVGRVRAFYGSPNNLALVLDRTVPLSLALALFGAFRPGRAWERALVGLASAIMLLACVVTYSKGALLLGLPVGIAVVLLAGAWRTRRRWPLWALAGLVVIGGVGLALLTRTPRFADLTNLDAGTGFFRLKLWLSSWRMFVDQPWLGVGPDNFLYAYRSRYVLPGAWQELNLSHPHNVALDLGTRLGVGGLLIGAWAWAGGIRRGWRIVRAGGDAWPLALGLLAGLLAALAHGLIDNSLFLIDLMALFMLALGILQRLDA